MNTKDLQLAAAFAATTDNRYWLNGVYITPTFIAASDGHRLVQITQDTALPDDIPVIIPIDSAKQFIKLIPKKLRDLAITIDKAGAQHTIKLGDTGVLFTPIDAKYPDFKRVIPDGECTGIWSHYNWEYLADAQSAVREHTGNKGYHVRFANTEGGKAYYKYDGVEIVIMGLAN